MSMLKFDINKVRELVSKADANTPLTLVGDHGVYLMSFSQKKDRTIVYAEGCNPDTDDDFYENKRALYGGDDGGDDISSPAELSQIIATSKKWLTIKLTATELDVSGK